MHLGEILSSSGCRIIVGKDDSQTSSIIEKQLCKGLMKNGCAIWLCGVAPLPALNFVGSTQGCDGIVMICTNGDFSQIAIYGKNGRILSSKEIENLDKRLQNAVAGKAEPPQSVERLTPIANVSADCLSEEELESELVINQLKKNRFVRIVEGVQFLYAKHLKSMFCQFSAQKIKLGVSSSTQSGVAPRVFRDLGCEVSIENALNENEYEHPFSFAKCIKKDEIGFAFNRDGSKLVAVVDKKVYDGDGMLLALSTLYRIQGKLKKKIVVGSTLSSSRLQRELAYHNTALYRAKSGENHVYEGLIDCGCLLGGERDGSILLLDKSTSSDPVLTALCLLEVKKTIGSLPRFVPYQTYEKSFYTNNVNSKIALENDVDTIKNVYNKKGRLLFLQNENNTTKVYFECFLQNYADVFKDLEYDLAVLAEKHQLFFD